MSNKAHARFLSKVAADLHVPRRLFGRPSERPPSSTTTACSRLTTTSSLTKAPGGMSGNTSSLTKAPAGMGGTVPSSLSTARDDIAGSGLPWPSSSLVSGGEPHHSELVSAARRGARRRTRATCPPPCRPAQCSRRRAPSRQCQTALSSRRRGPALAARRLGQGGSRRQTGARGRRRRGWTLGGPTEEAKEHVKISASFALLLYSPSRCAPALHLVCELAYANLVGRLPQAFVCLANISNWSDLPMESAGAPTSNLRGARARLLFV